ncbi:hypothetical protein, partial [Pseudomonas sp.]|uniref:ATP-binding cassette domain-containing protein n=1 Tax=Pseudomonas sp. TaxID=306 RepID=UPI0025846FAE
TVRAENDIWKIYVSKSADDFSKRAYLSGEKNRASLSTWLSSEAPSTIYGASRFYLGLFATLLNVALTSGVFFLTLGTLIGGAILSSLILSLICVLATRKRINELATDTQNERLSALIKINSLLTNGSCGTKKMYQDYKQNFELTLENYFSTTVSYTKMEQAIACAPTIVSVTIILASVINSGSTSISAIGALVAVLPRSLQLLGNVHTLGIYLSQFVMLRKKVTNLESFVAEMNTRNPEKQVTQSDIRIHKKAEGIQISVDDLMEICSSNTPSTGRYTIEGPNGSGKTSLLHAIKGCTTEAVILSTDTNFGITEKNLSTGQLQKLQMESIFQTEANVLLLDEWDANLDHANARILDAMVEKVAADKMVVEIRHRQPTI